MIFTVLSFFGLFTVYFLYEEEMSIRAYAKYLKNTFSGVQFLGKLQDVSL